MAVESIPKLVVVIVGAIIFMLVVLGVLGILGITFAIEGVSGSANSPLCHVCRWPCNFFNTLISLALKKHPIIYHIFAKPFLRCWYCKPFCGV